ncbi:MAG TPA: phosphatase PAP2 family protein [Gemmatimonas sp.]|nr:phosphatase PAP2 family protein [Gemmatimonas sp.]
MTYTRLPTSPDHLPTFDSRPTHSHPTHSHPTSRRARERAVVLGATAALAAGGFGALARASATRETAAIDEAVLDKTAPDPESPVRKTAHALAPVGKWFTYVPAAFGVAAYLLATNGRSSTDDRMGVRRGSAARTRNRAAGAGAIVVASGLAYVLSRAFDRWLPQPPAPPGHEDRDKPVFPSGHTFGPSAVGITAAYVLSAEGDARARIAAPVAVALPALLGGTRMIDERHWLSDVAGGLLGGICVASVCLTGFELVGDYRDRDG